MTKRLVVAFISAVASLAIATPAMANTTLALPAIQGAAAPVCSVDYGRSIAANGSLGVANANFQTYVFCSGGGSITARIYDHFYSQPINWYYEQDSAADVTPVINRTYLQNMPFGNFNWDSELHLRVPSGEKFQYRSGCSRDSTLTYDVCWFRDHSSMPWFAEMPYQ